MSDYPSRGGRPDPESWQPQARTPRSQSATTDYDSDGYDRYSGRSDRSPSRSRSGSGDGAAGTGSRSGGSRAAGRAVESASEFEDGDEGGGSSRGGRLGAAFLVGAVPALVLTLAAGTLAGGGKAKSIAGITLNSKLIELTVLGLVAGLAIIAALLRWRKIEPLGLTWTYGMIAGLSWLGLLFMAQVKGTIPHLPPMLTVTVITGAAFTAGAALTDDSTTSTGRYGLLAAVIASHIGIVAIVVSIVLA